MIKKKTLSRLEIEENILNLKRIFQKSTVNNILNEILKDFPLRSGIRKMPTIIT